MFMVCQFPVCTCHWTSLLKHKFVYSWKGKLESCISYFPIYYSVLCAFLTHVACSFEKKLEIDEFRIHNKPISHTCLVTNVSRLKHVWAQTCAGTGVWHNCMVFSFILFLLPIMNFQNQNNWKLSDYENLFWNHFWIMSFLCIIFSFE